jgi:hypothetical protein
MLLEIPFFNTRNNENKKMKDTSSLLPSSGDAFQEPTKCCLWTTFSLYGVIFGLLGKLVCTTFIINIRVKFSSTPALIVVLAATITACFWTISVFGVFRYTFSLQQYNQRQRFLFFCHFTGGCSVGSMLTSTIWSLLFFCTPVPLLQLYSDLMSCIGYLVFIIIVIQIRNWIHGYDELKEEGRFKGKDEGEMTTV